MILLSKNIMWGDNMIRDNLNYLMEISGIAHKEVYIPHCWGMFLEFGGTPFIFTNKDINTENHKNVVLAHEYAHFIHEVTDTIHGTRWMQDRAEVQARRWAAEYFLAPEKLITAVGKEHVTTPFELADYLEITLEQLTAGFEIMQDTHGPQLVHGQYIITWCPFDVRKDCRRRAV